jgi:hypothetical protein
VKNLPLRNVSIKNKLIIYLAIGVLILPALLIVKLLGHEMFMFLLYVLPVWLLFFWGTVLMHLNAADISMDKKTETITITTLFKEKVISIKNFQINNYNRWSRKSFAFYTNSGRIILNQTEDNCQTMMNVFKKTKYKHVEYFIELQNERFGIGIFRFLKW